MGRARTAEWPSGAGEIDAIQYLFLPHYLTISVLLAQKPPPTLDRQPKDVLEKTEMTVVVVGQSRAFVLPAP